VRRRTLLCASAGVLVLQACSGDNNNGDGGSDATSDTTQQDVSSGDVASDVAKDVAQQDASDGGCPSSWTLAPTVVDSLDVPDGGGGVILHAAGSGTQNYVCEATTTDAGTAYVWTFVGPQATLDDCAANLIGHHFASEAGAAAPEWQTLDNSYVIGKKLAAYTADAAAVPWLLLQETSNAGTGTIASTLYIQRVNTSGGVAPSSGCDSTTVGNTSNQAYTADYYFYGP
jgi:hypothetical protein